MNSGGKQYVRRQQSSNKSRSIFDLNKTVSVNRYDSDLASRAKGVPSTNEGTFLNENKSRKRNKNKKRQVRKGKGRKSNEGKIIPKKDKGRSRGYKSKRQASSTITTKSSLSSTEISNISFNSESSDDIVICDKYQSKSMNYYSEAVRFTENEVNINKVFKWVRKIIDPNLKRFFDVTCCCGGESWVANKYFDSVVSSDINKEYVNLAISNGIDAIVTHPFEIKSFNNSLVYFDPPWKNILKESSRTMFDSKCYSYINKSRNEVMLSIHDYVKRFFEKGAKAVLLKLPKKISIDLTEWYSQFDVKFKTLGAAKYMLISIKDQSDMKEKLDYKLDITKTTEIDFKSGYCSKECYGDTRSKIMTTDGFKRHYDLTRDMGDGGYVELNNVHGDQKIFKNLINDFEIINMVGDEIEEFTLIYLGSGNGLGSSISRLRWIYNNVGRPWFKYEINVDVEPSGGCDLYINGYADCELLKAIKMKIGDGRICLISDVRSKNELYGNNRGNGANQDEFRYNDYVLACEAIKILQPEYASIKFAPLYNIQEYADDMLNAFPISYIVPSPFNNSCECRLIYNQEDYEFQTISNISYDCYNIVSSRRHYYVKGSRYKFCMSAARKLKMIQVLSLYDISVPFQNIGIPAKTVTPDFFIVKAENMYLAQNVVDLKDRVSELERIIDEMRLKMYADEVENMYDNEISSVNESSDDDTLPDVPVNELTPVSASDSTVKDTVALDDYSDSDGNDDAKFSVSNEEIVYDRNKIANDNSCEEKEVTSNSENPEDALESMGSQYIDVSFYDDDSDS
jgi:hypothetical protein